MTNRRGLVAALVAASLAAAPAASQDRRVIAAASYPLAYFAERLAGDAADVVFPVPAGADPSFWRPSIADITTIQGADLIALNGAGFDAWTTRTSLPRSRVVDTSAGFADDYIATEAITHSHGAEGEHSHTPTASYTWLDLDQAARQAEALATAMERAMPDMADAIAANLLPLQDDLAAIDARADALDDGGPLPAVIASHPRYQYFGRAYGLDLAAVDWEAGAVPTAEQVATLETLVAKMDARVFIWEAEPPPEAREMLDRMKLVQVVFPPLAARPRTGDLATGFSESLADLEAALTDAGSNSR